MDGLSVAKNDHASPGNNSFKSNKNHTEMFHGIHSPTSSAKEKNQCSHAQSDDVKEVWKIIPSD